MAVIIDEVVTEAIKPAAPSAANQPASELPADTEADARRILAVVRRREARAQRLRAD